MKLIKEKQHINILAFFDYFYPAVKSGGPSRSSLGFVENLSSEISINIITRDRDHKENQKFKNIESDQWISFKGAHILYSSPKRILSNLVNAARSKKTDIYYFNSFFSIKFSVIPLLLIKLNIIPKRKVILAPRGELALSAFNQKSLKKKMFLFFFRNFLLSKNITFQASSEFEKKDILQIINKKDLSVRVAPNLRPKSELLTSSFSLSQKESGKLRVVLISRITPVKNIELAVQIIKESKGQIVLHIYGFLEDLDYWENCITVLKNLPKNKSIEYKGVLPQEKVVEKIKEYDLFFLPTQGENFGHSILEALIACRPVLISNKTPWRNLVDKSAGWDVPLESPENFQKIINDLVSLNKEEYDKFCEGAYHEALGFFNKQNDLSPYKELFYI